MNTFFALVIVVAAATIASVLMLLVRRKAPAGGFFSDSDRAAGVFGVIGTGFAIILGLVILMSFEVYSTVNEAARTEAVSTHAIFNDEHVFPVAVQGALQGDLVCYARSVIHQEWPSMEQGQGASRVVGDWAGKLDAAVMDIAVDTPKQEVNYAAILDKAATREGARETRLLEAESVLPNLFWLVLLTGAIAVICFMLFWADSAERKRVQVLMAGSVTGMITASLLLVSLLDSPIGSQAGKIQPTEMMRIQTLMQAQTPSGFQYPCDEQGLPTA